MTAGLFCAAFLCATPTENLQRFEYERREMGVSFRISLYACKKTSANKAAEAAFSRIAELNQIMSDYNPESELMRLTRTAVAGEPMAASADLRKVLQHSRRISCMTNGAFDVTVGPIVQLWRRARRRREFPDRTRLEGARHRVGWELVKVDDCAGTVTLMKPGMRLDLGGIAKGYAADEALRVLRNNGIRHALINASGDIVAGDAPPGKAYWKVALQMPITEQQRNLASGKDENSKKSPTTKTRYLRLKNAAVATSGDVFQFVEFDGVRYSHIVNPKTGLGLTSRSQVTIIAPNGTTADAIASAVSVLGPQEGLQFVECTGRVESFLVVAEPEQQVRKSRCFQSFLVP